MAAISKSEPIWAKLKEDVDKPKITHCPKFQQNLIINVAFMGLRPLIGGSVYMAAISKYSPI